MSRVCVTTPTLRNVLKGLMGQSSTGVVKLVEHHPVHWKGSWFDSCSGYIPGSKIKLLNIAMFCIYRISGKSPGPSSGSGKLLLTPKMETAWDAGPGHLADPNNPWAST